jgi:hypothetical protein
MHIGRADTTSETEAMYCPVRGNKCEEYDTSNFVVADGFIYFCEEVPGRHHQQQPYLGAFWSLRPCILKKKGVSRRVKGMIYSSLVLSVLLYSSECWCLTKRLSRCLRLPPLMRAHHVPNHYASHY